MGGEAFQTFLEQYPTKTYDKGEIIVYQDDQPTHAYVVKRGFVKAYTITAEGDQNVIGFAHVQDMFPVSSIFGKDKRAIYFEEALTECEIYLVPREEYVHHIKQHPRLFQQLFNYFVEQCVDYQRRVHSLEQAKAADKLLFTIAHLVERYGTKVKRSCIRMTLPLTQQDFAALLGLTRETAGTQLKRLEKQGVIKYRRQKYLVYTDKLHALLENR